MTPIVVAGNSLRPELPFNASARLDSVIAFMTTGLLESSGLIRGWGFDSPPVNPNHCL